MKKIFSLTILSLILFSSVAPLALAAEEAPATVANKISTLADLMDFINKIINWIFTALLVVAVIMVLMAAFQFLTAGGNQETIKKAQNSLLYALIAIVIGALAKGLVLVVTNLLGVKVNF